MKKLEKKIVRKERRTYEIKKKKKPFSSPHSLIKQNDINIKGTTFLKNSITFPQFLL